ncbi:MAG: GHKL domain-containing protein [Ferruginibacter sp.]|nr:GHKL domain-containing protein [Ferruginibacter sp.]
MRQFLFVLTFFISWQSQSQLRELRFDRLTVEEGLPENYVTCSIQDKYGYLWFGTQNGLVRYDGYNVKVYNLQTADKKERQYRSIVSLFEDGKGNIWVGTLYEGLFRFNRKADNFTLFTHNEKNSEGEKERVLAITEDAKGHIWTSSGIALGGKATYHLDRLDPNTGNITKFDSSLKGAMHLPSKGIYSLQQDAQKNIWAGTGNGLFKYDAAKNKASIFLSSADPNHPNRFLKVYEAPSEPGIFWISVVGNGLWRFDAKNEKHTIFRHLKGNIKSLVNDTILSLTEDKQKRLWIGTRQGLSLLDRSNGAFTNYKTDQTKVGALPDVCVDIKQGKDGALWIAGFGMQGILYLSSPQAKLKRFLTDDSDPNGLPTNFIYNSLVDRNGVIWFGTRGDGMLKLNQQRSQFTYIHKNDQPGTYPGKDINGIVKLPDGGFIVSTATTLFEANDSLTQFKKIIVPGSDTIKPSFAAVMLDKQGMVWISTSAQGLFSFNPLSKKYKRYINNPKDSTSITSNNLRRPCYEDSKGNFWVSTYGGGLCKLDRATGKFTRYPFIFNTGGTPTNGALDDDQVSSILEDSKGVLWIGTNSGGLNKYDEATGKFKSYHNTETGMQCVVSLYEDRAGRFWVGTYLWGLFLFDRETGKYRRFLEKDGLAYDNVSFIKEDNSGNIWLSSGRGFSILNPKDFSIKKFTTAQGMPTNELLNSRTISNENDWLVTATEGIIRFNPDNLIVNKTEPEVFIQSLSHTQTDTAGAAIVFIDKQKEIELAYDENRISFQYVGIHYANSRLNQYEYKVEGYDKDWIKAGRQRTATYTNLSPGTYTFFVKAANSDGIWSKNIAQIKVVIHPPWWKTWWAYLLYILAFALAIWTYLSYRSKALRRENKILEEKVEHRTSQLQSSIESLKATQAQLIQSEKMASLGELTAGIAHEIQNPLNFVNNFSEVSNELINEMKEELVNGNKEDAFAIADDIKQNLEKINHHGKRADAIVKGMLQHSRANAGKKELTDINALADEYLRLSYHGLRANDKSFNANFTTNFDESMESTEVIPQDIGRVLLNLYNNAFYSVNEKKRQFNGTFQPAVSVSTHKTKENFLIQVRDNGNGIPQKVLDKIYQPFFTTKPTGEGTGLGLSLSYDIVKAHGGEIKVETKEGEYTEFVIIIPSKSTPLHEETF